MAVLGRFITGGDNAAGTTGVNNSNQRATLFTMTENGWGYQMGIWCGKFASANATLELAVYSSLNGSPDVRYGYTNAFTVTNLATDGTPGGGGAVYTANIATTNASFSPANNAVKMHSGGIYGLTFNATGAAIIHGECQASQAPAGSNTNMFFANTSTQPPTSPFAASQTRIEGLISIWLTYQPNRVPSTPASLSPTGFVTTQTPTLTATFADADATYGDKMNQYTVQVRRQSDQTMFWNQTFSASSTEQANNQTSRVYAGTTLAVGTTYEWRVQQSDQHSSWSAWTAWTAFTVNGGGTVTTAGTPTGKQLATSGYTFQGNWTHASSLAMTEVTVQLLQNGTVVQTGVVTGLSVPSSTAPGTAFSTTFAALGFASLPFGQSYTWQMKGKDSGGLYSPYSTPARAFTTDYPPNVPTALSPANNLVTSALPLLSCAITDPDDTPTAQGGLLVGKARLKGTPYLPNPSFAVDLGGWTLSTSGGNAGATLAVARDTTVYAGGGLKASITASTAAAGFIAHVDDTGAWIPCVPAESYALRATYRTDTANLKPLLQLRWYDSSFTLLSVTQQADWSPSVNTDYAQVLTGVAPVNALFFHPSLVLWTEAANVTGNLYMDAVSVDQGTRIVRTMTAPASGSVYTYQTVAGLNDVQTVAATGATAGTFTLTFNGIVTAAINWNDSAATIKTKIEALSTVGANNTGVTGGPLNTTPVVVTFVGPYSGTPQTVMVVTGTLTGATPTVAHTTTGATGDVTTFGSYAWDCWGDDATLTGATPSQATFVYAQGPVVVVSSPAANATITTSTPQITWTATGQVSYRIQVYSHGTTTVVYDSGTITSAVQSVQLPAGYLHNTLSYDIVVSVTNSAPLTGANQAQRFTLTYTSPATLPFTASAIAVGQDTAYSGVLLAWDPTAYPAGQFVQYILDRRNSGADPTNATILARLTNPGQVTFVDYLPASGQPYTYSVRQVIVQGTDQTVGVRSEADVTATFPYIVVCDALDGGTYRAVLSYNTDKSVAYTRDQQVLLPWGSSQPVILQSGINYRVPAGSFTLLPDSSGSAAGYLNALRALWNNGNVVCFRDDRGRKIFGLLSKFAEKDELISYYTVDVEITESQFVEGTV